MLKDYTKWMFDDVGNKIKNLAVSIAWTGIFLSILEGIVTFFIGIFYLEEMGYLILLGPVSAVLGCIAAWLGSLTLYGFGQLIVNTDKPRVTTPAAPTAPAVAAPLVTKKPAPAAKSSAHSWRCSTCGRMIDQNPCPFCTDVADKEIKQNDFGWVCPRCGKKNLKERPNCWSCGFKK